VGCGVVVRIRWPLPGVGPLCPGKPGDPVISIGDRNTYSAMKI
jgi:hypothetical protein